MFSSIAYASAEAAKHQPSVTETLFGFAPLVIIMLIFYFLIIRPQQKKVNEHQQTLNSLVKGDTVLTAGGIIAKVTKIEEGGKIDVAIAKDVEVKVQKDTILAVVEKKASKGSNKDA